MSNNVIFLMNLFVYTFLIILGIQISAIIGNPKTKYKNVDIVNIVRSVPNNIIMLFIFIYYEVICHFF